jgi:hypothetical protein
MDKLKSLLSSLPLLLAIGGTAPAMASMPSSGSCAFLMTLPVPYGASVTVVGETGYNIIGKFNFNSATSGTFSGRIVNPIFQTNNSPYILSKNIIDLNNFAVTISAMTPPNGFTGGYKIIAKGPVNGATIEIEFTAVPNGNGKSILMISTGAGTPNDAKLGPGSGVCQF